MQAGQETGGMHVMATAGKTCLDPQPVNKQNGMPSGIVRCADDSLNRAQALPCEPLVAEAACSGDARTDEMFACATDDDCTDCPYGRCVINENMPDLGPVFCACRYACSSDSDCDDGQACLCDGILGDARCIPATKTNADCSKADGSKGECALLVGDECVAVTKLVCRSEDDSCRSDADCTDGLEDACLDEGALVCSSLPACGRPLMVIGQQRSAQSQCRTDWMDELKPRLGGLSENQRRQLSQWWSEVGHLEHASVASFSRFSLQLMALGAPPALLKATQKATMDEIAHARMAYGLASAFQVIRRVRLA